ncbi:MAG: phosphoenolpyruvate--protein phosphotransferase, partial [Actinomycetota bacterium]
ITDAFDPFRTLLEAAGGYLAERVADLDDICTRVVVAVMGLAMPGPPESDVPFVLVARDLSPADTAELDPELVLALVTQEGGSTSHTAIIARSLGIPAVVSCTAAGDAPENQTAVVDGDRGTVFLAPHQALLAEIQRRRVELKEFQRSATGPGRTADDHFVALLANLGQVSEAQRAVEECEGVGLLRTEFLFLGSKREPSLEEQVSVYGRVFDAFAGKRVVVRTLDAGADKPISWLDLDAGQNPALGVRGLRAARRYPEVLEDQLEAIARAGSETDAYIWVMAPMVTTAAEAKEFVDRAHQSGLKRAGVMVEVPALAICADEIAGIVDFISIGTNDLCQYVTAADRMIGELNDLLDHWQPAVLRLVRDVVDGARAGATPVGVCGESASDPLFALVLAGLGVSSLSMSPAAVGLVRASLRAHTIIECRRLAKLALSCSTPRESRESVARIANLP